jgi:hypothetical protein
MMSESGGQNPLLVLVVVLVAAVLLAVTNPTAEQHRESIAADFSARRPLAGAVGLGAVSAHFSERHSFVFGSYTTEGDEVVSIGLLGMVWVVGVNANS